MKHSYTYRCKFIVDRLIFYFNRKQLACKLYLQLEKKFGQEPFNHKQVGVEFFQVQNGYLGTRKVFYIGGYDEHQIQGALKVFCDDWEYQNS